MSDTNAPLVLTTVEGEVLYRWPTRHLGGQGSGNFGHVGRPGEVGGSGAGALSPQEKDLFSTWQSGDATVYDDMRDPTTPLGRKTTQMLEKFPIHDGVSYRGLTLEDNDLAKLVDSKGVTLTLHSSASKSEDAAKQFMNIAKESYNGKPVLLELHGRTRDISANLQEEYFDTKETVAMAGSAYSFERLTHEDGYDRVTLREKR